MDANEAQGTCVLHKDETGEGGTRRSRSRREQRKEVQVGLGLYSVAMEVKNNFFNTSFLPDKTCMDLSDTIRVRYTRQKMNLNIMDLLYDLRHFSTFCLLNCARVSNIC